MICKSSGNLGNFNAAELEERKKDTGQELGIAFKISFFWPQLGSRHVGRSARRLATINDAAPNNTDVPSSRYFTQFVLIQGDTNLIWTRAGRLAAVYCDPVQTPPNDKSSLFAVFLQSFWAYRPGPEHDLATALTRLDL